MDQTAAAMNRERSNRSKRTRVQSQVGRSNKRDRKSSQSAARSRSRTMSMTRPIFVPPIGGKAKKSLKKRSASQKPKIRGSKKTQRRNRHRSVHQI